MTSQNQPIHQANQKMSKIGAILAIVALSQLLVSLIVVMSVSPALATLAASPIYAGAGITLMLAAILISRTLFHTKDTQKNPDKILSLGAFCALCLILLLLVWGYFAGINFGALALAMIVAIQGPLCLFGAKIWLNR